MFALFITKEFEFVLLITPPLPIDEPDVISTLSSKILALALSAKTAEPPLFSEKAS